MSNYAENIQSGLSHADADALAYVQAQNETNKQQYAQASLDNAVAQQNRGRNNQSRTSSVFKTPLAAKIPNWLYGVFALAGAISAIVALQLFKPSIIREVITLDASWVEWIAFPGATLAGFFAGGFLITAIAEAIEMLVNLLLSVISIAVILGIAYIGYLIFGTAS